MLRLKSVGGCTVRIWTMTCIHRRQSRSRSNQYQKRIVCEDCGKVLLSWYFDLTDPDIVARILTEVRYDISRVATFRRPALSTVQTGRRRQHGNTIVAPASTPNDVATRRDGPTVTPVAVQTDEQAPSSAIYGADEPEVVRHPSDCQCEVCEPEAETY